MKYKFTAIDVAREVRTLAAERPDHVYERGSQTFCTYAPNHPMGAPEACLIGQALARLGVPVSTLVCQKGTAGVLIYDMTGSHPMRADICGWLDRVQAEQDDSVPWAEAVALADQCVPLVAVMFRAEGDAR
jgi:hypothetical protein